jgi:O-antigen/teichoic acid export membrane protein
LEFGKHIGKGLWAFADKALPVVYGLGFVVLVIRTLAPEEYGLYVLVQTIFLILFTFAYSIALQPMLKFVAEGKHAERYITAGSLLYTLFFGVASLTLWLLQKPLAALLNAERLVEVIFYVPLLVAASLVRNIVVIVLQAHFQIRRIFLIDAMHFLGSLILLAAVTVIGKLTTAEQVLQINVFTFFLSSLLALMLGRTLVRVSTADIGRVTAAIWDFGKYTFASNAGYTLATQADTFVLSWYSGPIVVATYNAAKVFYRGFDIVTQVIHTFVIPASAKFTAENNRGELQAMFEKAVLFTTIVLVPCSIAIIILAPTVMHLFYGTKYDEAIGVLQILAVALLAVPWLATIAGIMVGIGTVRMLFYAILIYLTISILVLVLFIPRWNIHGAALALVVSQAVAAVVVAVAIRRTGFVDVHVPGILARRKDIAAFLKRVKFLHGKG